MLTSLIAWCNGHVPIINIRCERIMMDNEPAMVKSLKQYIPAINISLYYFHVCQAWNRWLKHWGYILLYYQKEDFYNFVRLLRVLAFVPVELVISTYKEELVIKQQV